MSAVAKFKMGLSLLTERILPRHKYQPVPQVSALQTVLLQAETLSSTWSVPRHGSGGGNG